MGSRIGRRIKAAVEVATYVVLGAAVMGAGGAWGRADWGLLVIAACIAGAATLIAMRASDARAALAPVALLGAFAVLHAVQLLPRPGWMPGALWPGRLAVEERIGTAAITGGFWRPASMDSSATVDSLLLLAAYASAALVGGAVFGRRTRFVRLAAVLGAVGLAAAAAGLGGFLGGKGLHPGRLSGSYTNPNRFCDLLCLGLGASVAAAVLLGGGWVDRLGHGLYERALRRRELRWGFVAAAVGLQLAALATVSRLGILSLVLAAATVAALAGSREGLSKRLGAVLGIAAVVALVNVSLAVEPVHARFSALFEPGELGARRPACWLQSMGLIRDFPVIGSGAGSYTSLFAAYQRPGLTGHFRYPHSEVVGILCEFGLVGGSLAAAGAFVFFRRMVKALSAGVHRSRRAAPGLCLGLGAVTIHSLADYGLRVPATGFVYFLLAGAAWRLVSRDEFSEPAEPAGSAEPRGFVPLRVVGVVLLAAAAWWAGWSAAAGRLIEGTPPPMEVFEDRPVAEEIGLAGRAAALSPRLPEGRYRLARASWLKAVRSASASEAAEEIAAAQSNLLALLRTRPVDGPALHMLAVVEEALGEGKRAEAAALAALKSAPAYDSVQLNGAKLLTRRAAAAEALGEADLAAKLRGEAAGALVRASRSGRSAATTAIRYAVGSGFGEDELGAMAGAAGAAGGLALAQAYLESGKPEFALECLGRLRREKGLTRGEAGTLEFLSGTASLVAGDAASASEAFRRHVMLTPRPELAPVLALHVRAFVRAGKHFEGLEHLKSLEARLGDCAPLYAAMGRLAQRARRGDLAIDYYERALEIDPAAGVAEPLARLLVSRGEIEQALPVLRGALARDAHNDRLRLFYAEALLKAGYYSQAHEEIVLLKGGSCASQARVLEATLRRKIREAPPPSRPVAP